MNLPSGRMTGKNVVPRTSPGSEVAPADKDGALITPPDAHGEIGQHDPHFNTDVSTFAEPTQDRKILAGIAQLGLFVVIVWIGMQIYGAIIGSAPIAERAPRERVARLVEVVEAKPARQGPVINAWGEVRAAQTLIVRPEISGMLAWVHPEMTPGGRLSAGEVVARLDTSDLELAVLRAKSDIADIDARKELERGQAALGERELSRLSRNITEAQRNLVLRKPQMAQLEAERAAAVAALGQAENALARAEVRVPFDALVISESVAPGGMVSVGAEAATLVAADRFHVVLAVPAAALGWIGQGTGQVVQLTQEGIWPAGTTREGRIVRRGSAVSETGRMAELIVEVEDPLATGPDHAGAPSLLLGSFVEARIEADTVPDTIAIDRALLRDDDTVWVMTPENELDIRTVDVVWRGAERVLIRGGLAAGDRVVATTLSSFAAGMALRTLNEEVSG